MSQRRLGGAVTACGVPMTAPLLASRQVWPLGTHAQAEEHGEESNAQLLYRSAAPDVEQAQVSQQQANEYKRQATLPASEEAKCEEPCDDASFEIIDRVYDIIDMNEDSKVTPLELSSFIGVLLWKHCDPGLRQACDVIHRLAEEAVPQDGNKHAYLRPRDVVELQGKMLGCTELLDCLADTNLLANTLLLRQFLRLDYKAKVLPSFGFGECLQAYVLFQFTPIFILLEWMTGKPFSSPIHGWFDVAVLQNVRQLLLQRTLFIVSFVPAWMRKWFGKKPFYTFGLLSSLAWVCVYGCMVAWWALNASQVVRAHTSTEFVALQDPRQEVAFFEAHAPFIFLQAILIGSAVKVALKDGDRVDAYATVVRDLGSLSQSLPHAERHDCTGSMRAVIGNAAQQAGMEVRTLADLLDRLQQQVTEQTQDSFVSVAVNYSTIIVPVFLAVWHRLVRLCFVGNFAATSSVFGQLAAFSNIYCVLIFAALLWHECAELVQFLWQQWLRTWMYSKLFSRGEAVTSNLPCLKNRNARSIVIWAKLRFYVQCPNVIEMRWLECFLVSFLVAATIVVVIFFVTLFQGALLSTGKARNGDLQAGLLFITMIFLLLGVCVLVMIFTAVRIGNVYRADLKRLKKEVFDVQCKLTQLDEPYVDSLYQEQSMPITTRLPPASSPSVLGKETIFVPRATFVAAYRTHQTAINIPFACRWRNSRNITHKQDFGRGYDVGTNQCFLTSITSADVDSMHGTERSQHGIKTPLERQQYSEYLLVVEKLVAFLESTNEYLEVFGIPIDTQFRNALFSVLLAGIVAVLSSLMALVAKYAQQS